MTEHDREGEPAAQQAQENAAEKPTGTAGGSDRSDEAAKPDKEGEPAAEQARDNDAGS